MDPQRLFGPVTTRNVRIDQFDAFILNNIPYAQVQPRHVNWGAVEYDGPDAPGIDGGKPALQWHFGGVPYPITKAIRINYTYVRKWDGSNAVITTAIYLGFQDALHQYVLPQVIPFVAAPTPTFVRRIGDLGQYGGFSTHSWASDVGILASEAQSVITRSVQYDAVNLATFNTFIRAEMGLPPIAPGGPAAALSLDPIPVDFDGPAQDYDSHKPFEYTFATLQNEPEKYSQLLFWYFAGKPFRLTKAMRIPLDDGNAESAVLATARARQDALALSERLRNAQKEAHELSEKLASGHSTVANQAKEALQQVTELQSQVNQVSEAGGGNALFVGYSGPDPGGAG